MKQKYKYKLKKKKQLYKEHKIYCGSTLGLNL